jgi:hypothetical protein
LFVCCCFWEDNYFFYFGVFPFLPTWGCSFFSSCIHGINQSVMQSPILMQWKESLFESFCERSMWGGG